jgi:predicted DNA-binding protein with PD1-like motif
MRNIKQPGPVHPERVQCARTKLRAVDVQLQQGVNLLDGLADVVRSHGVCSAVFSLQGGSFEPLAFHMPAIAASSEHVAYFSERFESAGEARIDSGSITFGLRGGKPSLHCHAIWTEASGQRKSGHLIPSDSRVASPLRLQAWMLEGAGFEVAADSETNFSLMQVSAAKAPPDGATALVIRLRPNQDLCTALEEVCVERNIRRASIRGGVGSLIGAVFDDGRTVDAFVTEVFIRSGEIELASDGSPRASVDVGLVAHSGEIAEGRLKRGENPVLITFELVIEPKEKALAGRSVA